MGSDSILTEIQDRVLVTTFNRPERMNTLSTELLGSLFEALEFASTSDDVRAMLITGAGRAWCAGAEIGAARADRPEPTVHERLARNGSAAMVEAFAACDVPIIAAINGPAVGGGFGLALCCDVRIAAESARIGSIFIKRGLATDYGASYWLPRIVGVAKSYELLYSGRPLSGSEAVEAGLAMKVVPDADLMNESLAYAKDIAKGPPLAYAGTRRLVLRSLDSDIHEFPDYEWNVQRQMLASDDGKEGFKAFLEKREPEFTGR
jgi:enoyl-CoA hydratase/carnithine racemase